MLCFYIRVGSRKLKNKVSFSTTSVYIPFYRTIACHQPQGARRLGIVVIWQDTLLFQTKMAFRNKKVGKRGIGWTTCIVVPSFLDFKMFGFRTLYRVTPLSNFIYPLNLPSPGPYALLNWYDSNFYRDVNAVQMLVLKWLFYSHF